MTESAVERVRAQIPVIKKQLFFNTGWSGPSPLPVIDEQRRMLDWLSSESVSHHTYERLRKNIEQLRSRLAAFFSVDTDEIALTHSTTEAINIVLCGIEWRPGQRIMTTNIEHGAALVPVYNLRDRYGISADIVDLRSGKNAVRTMERAIKDGTRLVVASHVSFNTGIRLPLKELSRMVADHGAELLIDGAQSVGVFPINLNDSGCDYYAFPGHKWLLGPDSVGGLFIRKEKLSNLKIGFAGNESVKKYDPQGNAEYQQTAKKFEYSDFNAALIAGWIKALDFCEEFGMKKIEAAIQNNTNYLKRRLATVKNIKVVTPMKWEKSAGLVSIQIIGRESKEVFFELLKRGIIARFTPQPSYIRFSVNYFNTKEELEQVIAAVRQVCKR